MYWFDLLAVQCTLWSFLQHHCPEASILQLSAFSVVQLSHPYMTTGKAIALTRQIFVSKVMFLLFNMLYELIIAVLPKSKLLLISWLQSPSAVILEPKKIKSATVSIYLGECYVWTWEDCVTKKQKQPNYAPALWMGKLNGLPFTSHWSEWLSSKRTQVTML